MQIQSAGKTQRPRKPSSRTWVWFPCFIALYCLGCHSTAPVTIAVIPRTSGTGLWEPEHGGAEVAAVHANAHIYWNAPTREDDVEGQIAIVNQVISKGYQGLVLAPDQALALIAPVRRALARGIPTVIVGSPLPLPAGENLSYILSDEATAGRIAAQRVAELLHGRGSVAVLGVNPDIAAIMIRTRSLELFLAQEYPNINVIKKMGSFDFLHEQQMADETLKANPEVKVIVGMMWASARAAISAVEQTPGFGETKVIAFDPDGVPPFDIGFVDSVIKQDTRTMGQLAVDLIDGERHGRAMPALITLQPLLITRENMDSPEIRRLTSMDWRPTPWAWSTTH
jgi:ribose transport system substrate-binding protein